MRVPPDQSETVAETRARPASGSRPASSRVTRVRWVPKTNVSARTPLVRRSAIAKRIEQARVALHGAADVADEDDVPRPGRRTAPEPLDEVAPAWRLRRSMRRASTLRPFRCTSLRRVRRRSSTGLHLVDEAFRIPHLGRRHAHRRACGAPARDRPLKARRPAAVLPVVAGRLVRLGREVLVDQQAERRQVLPGSRVALLCQPRPLVPGLPLVRPDEHLEPQIAAAMASSCLSQKRRKTSS